ncbi:MAG: ABC transporter permease [Thermoplasmata archaeon]|nr:ABC transporter permease [Thermoplasmata archaeon]
MSKVSLFSLPKISMKTWKVWRRDARVFMKTYKVNFVPPALEPILYLLALGFGLGLFVSQIDGVSYPVFIAPALLAISMMNAAFFECTYSSFVRMYYQKTFDAIIATPLNLDEVIFGELLWGATKSTIYGSIVLVVITAFGLASYPASLLIIPFSFLVGMLFSSIAMCFTALSPRIDSLNYPISLFITPMFLVSGTFFPISALPTIIQQFTYIGLPLVHVVDITRALTYGSFDFDLLLNLLWIVVVTVIITIISINLMKRRLIV